MTRQSPVRETLLKKTAVKDTAEKLLLLWAMFLAASSILNTRRKIRIHITNPGM